MVMISNALYMQQFHKHPFHYLYKKHDSLTIELRISIELRVMILLISISYRINYSVVFMIFPELKRNG